MAFDAGRFRFLKPGVEPPGNPGQDEHWTEPPVVGRQFSPRFVTLPAGFSTRAVLCTDTPQGRRSQLTTWRFFARRLHNIIPQAVANAEAEYTAYPFASAPFTYYASHIPAGRGRWVSHGPDKKDKLLRPPISALHPCWFTLGWREEQGVSGICLKSNFVDFRLYRFIGPPGLNPAAGTDAEWKRIRNLQVSGDWRRWVSFDPVRTRGLKLLILKTGGNDSRAGQTASIDGMHVLSDLGDGLAPPAPKQGDVAPPFAIPYEIAQDGVFTMAVNDERDRRVRNLVATVEREKGEGAERWDLKTEDGRYVKPGVYRWTAITHPPLGLRYEMTPYPNVTTLFPERSAWQNGHSGPGGWMADHSAPRACCVAQDRVFFGSPVSESGVSLVECDLDGRRHWAHRSFAAFTGVHWLATDDKTVFVGASAHNAAHAWNVSPKTEVVWGVDIKTHSVREVARLVPTTERRRGIKGMAARDGKLYISVRADARWLSSAASSEDVDLRACLPRYASRRAERYHHEIVPDPQGDFLRLFRLKGTPPGMGLAGELDGLVSTRGPESKQFIVLAFRRPTKLGGVVYAVPQKAAYRVRLSVLKPGGQFPPDPGDEERWRPFERHGDLAWDVAAAPPDTVTRALRITFRKGEEDLFGEVAAGGTGGPGLDALLDGDIRDGEAVEDGAEAWRGGLDGMKLLRRRYENLFPTATVRVNSGHVDEYGVWDARPAEPISWQHPGIYVMQWDRPQEVRGAAVKEIDGRLTVFDIYTGREDADIDIEADADWEEVARCVQARRDLHSGFSSCNATARYLDSYVDFGRTLKTRAVRLRIVEQWSDHGHKSDYGYPKWRGGKVLDPRRCAVFGVAPLRYLGGESPVDGRIAERVEVLDTGSRRIVEEVHLPAGGDIAFGPDGRLFAVSGARVVEVDMKEGAHRTVIDDLVRPQALALGRDGQFYVFDGHGDRRNIRVYDPQGKHMSAIGEPGGYSSGPWRAERFSSVTALGADRQGHLWAVDGAYWPKRISQWALDGRFIKEIIGPTAYGGGGVLDPWDKSRMRYGPLEFELDWTTGKTRISALTSTDAVIAGEQTIHVGDRVYLVNRPGSWGGYSRCGVVRLYGSGRSRLVAAMGAADTFPPLKEPGLHAELGSEVLTEHRFHWADLDGDGKVQAGEVVLTPRADRMPAMSPFGRDLGIQCGEVRWQVKEFLPDGVPVYEEKLFPALKGRMVMRMDNGDFFELGSPNRGLTPEGEVLWRYPSTGVGVHALYSAAPYFPGQVVAEFYWIGHETAHAGELGEFFVVHTNVGDWNIWTSDGLLAGHVFTGFRTGRARPWNMLEHERGMRLDGITVGQEHFSGHFCRTRRDNRYYAVAGHNHASLVEVLGMDGFRRPNGTLEVTAEDLKSAQEWERRREERSVYRRAPVADCYRMRNAPQIDGRTDDWPWVSAEMGDGERPAAWLRMGFDERWLYLCYGTQRYGPMKNSGTQLDRIFRTGAGVDLQMGTDPAAPAGRRTPVAGDLRLLMTYTDAGPIAVLYRPVAPRAEGERSWVIASPTGKVVFDRIEQLKGVRTALGGGDGRGYVLEAAVPLKNLGLKPRADLRLKMDWGMLVSGENGREVMQRIYWSNKATGIIADAPSEAALRPDLWGHIRFHDEYAAKPDIRAPGRDDVTDPDVEEFVNDIVDELKGAEQ